nr:CHASE domain-containing protein [Pseudomonadota bacterium]
MKVAHIRLPLRMAGAGWRWRWALRSAARLVLVFCLAVTVWTWHLSRVDARRQGRDAFEQIAGQVTQAVHDRMRAYEQVLRGAVGLFLAAGEVTRRDWRIYVENLALDKSYPGIQGVGFARLIASAGREAHIRQVRAEGFADYTLWPAGERDIYTAIVYLEPFDWRNRRAFGYDMFSEPVRRAAMERAWYSGRTAVSGKITLVQETGRDPQTGFLMYLPLYAADRPLASEAQRRAALRGWVYSPFRLDDLMQGILGRQLANVALEIHDGGEA